DGHPVDRPRRGEPNVQPSPDITELEKDPQSGCGERHEERVPQRPLPFQPKPREIDADARLARGHGVLVFGGRWYAERGADPGRERVVVVAGERHDPPLEDGERRVEGDEPLLPEARGVDGARERETTVLVRERGLSMARRFL